jgi:hypothetical protein
LKWSPPSSLFSFQNIVCYKCLSNISLIKNGLPTPWELSIPPCLASKPFYNLFFFFVLMELHDLVSQRSLIKDKKDGMLPLIVVY